MTVFAVGLEAHDLGRSESVVVVRGGEVRARVVFDLLEFGGVDTNGDGAVSYGELDREIDRVYPAIKAHFMLTSPSPPARVSLERYAVQDGHVARFDLLFAFPADVTRLTIHSTLHELLLPSHEHVASVSFGSEPATTTILDAATPEKTFNVRRSRLISLRQAALDALIAMAAGGAFYALSRRKRSAA